MVTVSAVLLKQWKPEGHCSFESEPGGLEVEFCAKAPINSDPNTKNTKPNAVR